MGESNIDVRSGRKSNGERRQWARSKLPLSSGAQVGVWFYIFAPGLGKLGVFFFYVCMFIFVGAYVRLDVIVVNTSQQLRGMPSHVWNFTITNTQESFNSSSARKERRKTNYNKTFQVSWIVFRAPICLLHSFIHFMQGSPIKKHLLGCHCQVQVYVAKFKYMVRFH